MKLLGAFYSAPFYNGLARGQQGIGGKLILALTLFMMLVLALPSGDFYKSFREALQKLPTLAAEMPMMAFSGGTLSIDKPSPYPIAFGNYRIVIDTTYKIADLAALQQKMKEEKIVLLMTADTAVSRDKNGELKIHDYKNIQPVTISHADWDKYCNMAMQWGLPAGISFFLISMFFGLFLFNFIATFFCAIIVAIAGAVVRAGLEFDAAMRLAAGIRLASTSLGMLPLIAGFKELGGWASWLLWAGYLVFAVAAARRRPA